jgi:hypothetical protein
VTVNKYQVKSPKKTVWFEIRTENGPKWFELALAGVFFFCFFWRPTVVPAVHAGFRIPISDFVFDCINAVLAVAFSVLTDPPRLTQRPVVGFAAVVEKIGFRINSYTSK